MNYKKTGWQLFDEYMLILNALWFIIGPILTHFSDPRYGTDEVYQRRPGGGHKHKPLREYLNTILYVLITGMQWNAVLPNPECGLLSGKAAHKWHMRLSRNGFYRELMIVIAEFFQLLYKYRMEWCSADCSLYKAPLALDVFGNNPTDRAKRGSKRSLIVDQDGLPLGFFIAGANQHDSKLLASTLENIFVAALKELAEKHLCLDKAYIGKAVQDILEQYGYEGHVQSRGEEKKEMEDDPDYEPKRWVVERTNGWYNCFRKLHTRYEKTSESHEGLTYLATMVMTIRTIFRSKEGVNIWANDKPKPSQQMYEAVGYKLEHFLTKKGFVFAAC